MGYTHYWTLNEKHAPNSEEWDAALKEIKELLSETDILCFDLDEPNSPPKFSERLIRFNGKGSDGHETFYVDNEGSGFNFCKTARKPYDHYVVETLKILKTHFPDWIELDSDGEDVFTGPFLKKNYI